MIRAVARLLARCAILAVALYCVQPLIAGSAYAWWNSDWSYRMKITADTSPKGANITDQIGRTQILVRLHSGNFNFATAKDDGTDLRFVAGDDRTLLHYHIEKFDGLIDQVALIWVDVPSLAPGGATPIYVYWGNKNADNASDSHATYDADQLLVYHFAEENGLARDSTGYGNNALTPAKRDPAGLIGNGARLDGSAPIQLPKSPSLAIAAGQPLTWSLWLRPDASSKTAILFSERDGSNAFTIGLDQSVAYAQVETADGTKRTTPGQPLAGEGWHLLSVIATADHLTVYVDGHAQGDVAASLPALAGQAALGGALPPPAAATPAPDASASAPSATSPPSPPANAPASPNTPPVSAPAPANFNGQIDEFELSKVARPLGTLQVAVASEGPDPKLLTFDVAEETSFFGRGYVGIILRSVSPDAWVVIGLLGVMSLISWWVMLSKALYLQRVGSANGKFRTEYLATLAAGRERMTITAPGGASKALQASPLYRLYELGSHAVNERLNGGSLQTDGTLTPQAIAAIRAAIDGAIVRENQRLNRMMVLLTIAISGGPFLGLLGTVVGVMITFAAVAQAGDVNVNAIAPGISAALLATVAGLFVAIPALFGYNYLLSRIRELTADMAVFADELIARIGEGVRITQLKAAE